MQNSGNIIKLKLLRLWNLEGITHYNEHILTIA